MKFGYRDKYDRNEIPYSPTESTNFHDANQHPWYPHRMPVNEYQALMETVPGDDIPMTEAEREADWLLFQQKIEAANLTEREWLVVSCIVFGGLSLARTATIVAQAEGLSKAPAKMMVARTRDKALQKIRDTFNNWEEE